MRNNSILLLLFLCLFLSTNILALPGDFDTSFNTTGKRRTSFGFGFDGANELVRLPDGKFIAVGYAQVGSNIEFAIARFTADGALDTSFGTGGRKTQDITGTEDIAYAVKLDPFGNIVVAGVSDALFTVARLFNNVAPTAASVSVSGRILSKDGSSISRAAVTLTDSNGTVKRYLTGAFGFYRFDDIQAGQTVIITVNAKRYRFTPQVLNVIEDVSDLDFTAAP